MYSSVRERKHKWSELHRRGGVRVEGGGFQSSQFVNPGAFSRDAVGGGSFGVGRANG